MLSKAIGSDWLRSEPNQQRIITNFFKMSATHTVLKIEKEKNRFSLAENHEPHHYKKSIKRIGSVRGKTEIDFVNWCSAVRLSLKNNGYGSYLVRLGSQPNMKTVKILVSYSSRF